MLKTRMKTNDLTIHTNKKYLKFIFGKITRFWGFWFVFGKINSFLGKNIYTKIFYSVLISEIWRYVYEKEKLQRSM